MILRFTTVAFISGLLVLLADSAALCDFTRVRSSLTLELFPFLAVVNKGSESRSVSPTLRPHGLQLARLLCPWDSPGKNTGVGSLSLLQGIFPTQQSNPDLPHCRRILYYLRHQGSKDTVKSSVQASGDTVSFVLFQY